MTQASIRSYLIRWAFMVPCGGLLWCTPPAIADHWPTRRYDAGRAATSPDILPEKLVRIWEYDFYLSLDESPGAKDGEPPPKKTPQELDDAITKSNLFFEETARPLPRANTGEEIYEPIIHGETVVLIHPDTGRITALNADDGELKWEHSLETPIRFLPVATDTGLLITACENGIVHCLALADGEPKWEFDAVAALRSKGSDRAESSSSMPVAKGPVVQGDKLYFAIGGWPFSGVYLFDVTIADVPDGGEPLFRFTEIPDHRNRGYLAAAGDNIFIPQGSDSAIAFDVKTGDLNPLEYETLGFIGEDLSAAGNWLIQGNHLIDLTTMQSERIGDGGGIFRLGELATELFFARGKKIVGARLFGATRYTAQSEAAGGAPSKTVMWQMPQRVIFDTFSDTQKERWTAGPLKADMVVAGRVFGRWGNALFAADIPDEGEPPVVSWSTVIDAVPISLAAADNKLFVMTVEGKLIVLSMEDTIHGADVVVNEEAAEDEKKADASMYTVLDDHAPEITEPLDTEVNSEPQVDLEAMPLLNLPPDELADTIYSDSPPDLIDPILPSDTPLNPGINYPDNYPSDPSGGGGGGNSPVISGGGGGGGGGGFPIYGGDGGDGDGGGGGGGGGGGFPDPLIVDPPDDTPDDDPPTIGDPTNPVPEPSTGILMLLAIIVCTRCRVVRPRQDN